MQHKKIAIPKLIWDSVFPKARGSIFICAFALQCQEQGRCSINIISLWNVFVEHARELSQFPYALVG